MKRSFRLVLIGCLALSLGAVKVFAQAPAPEISLDDNPANLLVMPFGPWGPGAPFLAPYLSAEDEFGLGLPASLAGFVGPSPTLPLGFYDSDVLVPGPALLLRFSLMPPPPPPPPPLPPVFYMDAVSGDHSTMPACPGGLFVRFSVDRATGGRRPVDASFQQAAANEQPGDIFRTDRAYPHVGTFVPLPVPVVPPWFYGGALPPAGTGILGGSFNQLMFDHWGTFGLLPAPPCPPITPGSHDNVDAFHEWPMSLVNTNIYFALHPASAIPIGSSPADIFMSPGGMLGFPVPVFAPSLTMGLDTFGFATDSIDGLALWDNGIIGLLEPGIDDAALSLAPGSATLRFGGLGLTAGDVFLTDFRGFFCTWLFAGDLGVGNFPRPPLPRIGASEINVDALDLTIDPDPVPYINPVTNPDIGQKTKID
jgi:hypothetical protein